MVLNTSNFNKYQKTIDKLTAQGSGIGRTIYLNFQQSKAYVINVQTLAQARIAFDFTLEGSEETPQNILLDASVFKNYYQFTDEMTVKLNSKSISVAYDTVKGVIPFMVDDETFTDDSYIADFEDVLTIPEAIYHQLHLASPWIASEDEQGYNAEALFIHDSVLYNGDSELVYLAPSDDLVDISIRLGREMVNNIAVFGENCIVSESAELTRLISEDGSAEYIEPMSLDYELDTFPVTDEFKSWYDGPDKVIVKTSDLLDAIAFIEPFVAQQVNKIFTIDLVDNKMVLSTESDLVGSSNKSIAIYSKTQDDISSSLLTLPTVKKALKAVSSDHTELTLNSIQIGEVPAMRLRGIELGSRRSPGAPNIPEVNCTVLFKHPVED